MCFYSLLNNQEDLCCVSEVNIWSLCSQAWLFRQTVRWKKPVWWTSRGIKPSLQPGIDPRCLLTPFVFLFNWSPGSSPPPPICSAGVQSHADLTWTLSHLGVLFTGVSRARHLGQWDAAAVIGGERDGGRSQVSAQRGALIPKPQDTWRGEGAEQRRGGEERRRTFCFLVRSSSDEV